MQLDIACAEHGFVTNCAHNRPLLGDVIQTDYENIPENEKFSGIWQWDSRVMKWVAYADETDIEYH